MKMTQIFNFVNDCFLSFNKQKLLNYSQSVCEFLRYVLANFEFIISVRFNEMAAGFIFPKT